MGAYLSTDITSPQSVAAGGVLAGGLTITPPAVGNYYMLMEQYSAELAFIPGSRAFLFQAAAGGVFVNNTTQHTNRNRVAAGVAETIAVSLTLPNTDCYTYIFLKERAAVVVAGAFVVGTTYEIMSIGTTDFTLVGAAASTVGLTFVATGVGVGTGTACVLADPDTDDTVDYVVITTQSSTAIVGGLDIGELMNLMITMMIVVMMMKMMTGMMSGL